MIEIVMAAFFLMLIIGVPVAHLVMASAALGITMQGGSSPMVLIQSMYEGLNSYVILAVPFFIISGDIAAKGNTSEQIVKAINVFLGRLRGGLGIATIVACAFFGAITGSAMATVVAIGGLMIPKLLENGYSKGLSTGLITTAGTLGVMIPPSVAMLITCVAMGTSVGKQFTAGFIPGILTALGFSIYTFFIAKKHNIPLQPKVPFKQKLKTIWECLPALMFPVIVLGSIYSGLATPTEAGVLSVIYVLLVELLVYKKLSFKELITVIKDSAVSAATMTLTVATAQVFVWFMTTAHVPDAMYEAITGGVTNKYLLWAGLCVLFLIAGCFTNVTNVVIILGPMLKSVLQFFSIDLIHFGIIVVIASQIGFVSPPFGICLFVAMKVAKASMIDVIKGSLPFLLIMLLMMVTLVLFPELSTWLPNLVYG